MTQVAVIDMTDVTVTPVFKIIEVENIPASEQAGRKVMETREVVEVRFAGSKNYVPVFPADGFWQREGNQVITYAERWPEQYRAFKEGNPQEAGGTPLEMLRDYGVTPEAVSLCRALRIYSIEALHALEGSGLKALGMNANALKDAARKFMAERFSATDALSEIEELKRRIAELTAGVVPAEVATEAEVDAALAAADAAFVGTDDELKDAIAKLAGARPRGNPNRHTLEQIYSELVQAKAA